MAGGSGLSIAAGFSSARGPRPENQDFAACWVEARRLRPEAVCALADGLGPERGGRVAAELAVRGFIDGYLSQPETLPPARAGARVLDALNGWLHGQAAADPQFAGMATTFTAAVLRGRDAHVFHVGDSRLYRLRDGRFSQLTVDHGGDPWRPNQLHRAVGADAALRIDYRCERLAPHDRLLLCSDGLHRTAGRRRLTAGLGAASGPQQTADALVQAALDAGAEDNVTALVVDILQLGAPDAGEIAEGLAGLPVFPRLWPGDTRDGLEIVGLVGEGPLSRAYEVRDLATGRAYLMKAAREATAAARTAMVREELIGAQVQHPRLALANPPPAPRSGLYTLQPFLRGETLAQRARRKPPLTGAAAVRLLRDLALALRALHRRGVIHRDVKPENIILDEQGAASLIDLDSAWSPVLEAEAGGFDIVGSPDFIAPELAAGGRADTATDIFSLGAAVYFGLTGETPFPSVATLTEATRRGPPRPLTRLRPDLPAWLDLLLSQAMAPDPQARLQDADELLYALEAKPVAAPSAGFRPLLERDPVRVWQAVAAILLALLVLFAALR